MSTVANLKAKAIRGGFSYFVRSVLTAILQIVSNLLIVLWLNPKDFGYFATVNLIIGVAQILADGGLSVYLIQRKEETNNSILSQIASLQLISYAVAHSITLIILIGLYHFNTQTNIAFYVFVSLFIIPVNILRANSFVNLERNMFFHKIAIIEVTESLIYAGSSLGLAIMGAGVWSLIFAVILKSIVGYGFSFYYCKWEFTFVWPRLTSDLKQAIKFGINFHIPALVTTLRLAINPIIIGGLLGIGAVGIADRAIYYAGLPLFFLGAIQQRVLFPYFARIQDNSDLVRSNFEKVYYLSSILDKIIFIPLVLFASEIINLYAPKWSQAVPLIQILLFANLFFGSLFHSSYPVLNGLGKSDAIAKLSIFSMLITWLCTWPLIKTFGLTGYAYLGIIIWIVVSVPSILILKRVLNGFTLWRPLLIPVGAFALSCIMIWQVTKYVKITLPWLGIFSLIATFLYLIFLYLIDGRYILKMISQLRSALLSNS